MHGGKTDPSNQYSYTSAPPTNDLLALDLSSSFSLDETPWVLLSGVEIPNGPQGPAIAFHTITAYSEDAILGEHLCIDATANLKFLQANYAVTNAVFGGDAGPSLPISTNPDSAWLLTNLSPIQSGSSSTPPASNVQWTKETLGWANEPIRRIYHSASAIYGNVWITGGSKDDGSMNAFNETWRFNPGSGSSSPSFSLIASNGAGLPDVVGHASILLANGTLLVFGGWSPSRNELMPLSTIWMIDAKSSGADSTTVTLSGQIPEPRRNFAFALLDGNKIIIHGGANAPLDTVFNDGWILDLNSKTWTMAPAMEAGLGKRFGHFAVGLGSQAMFGFGMCIFSNSEANNSIAHPIRDTGRSASRPADPGPYIYDTSMGTFITNYNLPPTLTLGEPGRPSPTTSRHTNNNTRSDTASSTPHSPTVSMVTYTTTDSHGSTYTSVGSTTVPMPTSPSKSPEDPGRHNGRIIGIAVGTVVGGMTIALASAAAIFILMGRRRHAHAGWGTIGDDYDPDAGAGAAGARFGLVWTASNEHKHDGDLQRDTGTPDAGAVSAHRDSLADEKGGALPIVGGWSHIPQRKKTGAWSALGVGRSPLKRGAYREPGAASAQARLDMLADEDERVFDFGNLGPYAGRRAELSRNTTVASNNSAGSAMGLPWFKRTASNRNWAEAVNDGVSSVKALGRSISGSRTGQPPTSSDRWERHPEYLDAEAGLLADDEIAQRAASVDATLKNGGAQDSNEITVILVSDAARMRGGASGDIFTDHSQASSFYRDPFADDPDDIGTAAPLLALGHEASDGARPPTRDHAATLTPPLPTAAVAPRHSRQAPEGLGGSVGAGMAGSQPASIPLLRPPSSSTVASITERGPPSDQSHGSGIGSSGSSGAALGRSSVDTQHTIISSAPMFAPVRRSSSWWGRFSALPLRTTSSSETGVTAPAATSTRRLSFRLPGSGSSVALDPKYAIDFRDPNPPPILPSLHAIEESANSPDGSPQSPNNHGKESTGGISSSADGGSNDGAVGSRKKRDNPGHRAAPSSYNPHATAAQSSASLRTTKTADSDIAEKMATGHYHAVQRAGTPSHHEPSSSKSAQGSMSSAYPSEGDAGEKADEVGDLVFVTSPVTSPIAFSPVDDGGNGKPVFRPLPPLPPPRKTPATTGVAARIAEFERRATLSQSGSNVPGSSRLPSPSTAAEKRQRTTTPPENTEKTQRTKVRWSVTERPALFVANPDDTRRRDGTGDSHSAASG